ncbi:uncharacterized protein B0H18DRAFT_958004 [Fomitopsis serialis]|uniref:uncharacterized protein n=1 Tax=Fomitopsis serialis TaxID=139415 RepID=UPI0020077CA0|nr:uncharacterized protein B0H18DRAFT_958004 [Neoantrodia serialis]KAH9918263.1 hypothetical protein B0H18DRAFT_958004 [Neoantrodia serialis]
MAYHSWFPALLLGEDFGDSDFARWLHVEGIEIENKPFREYRLQSTKGSAPRPPPTVSPCSGLADPPNEGGYRPPLDEQVDPGVAKKWRRFDGAMSRANSIQDAPHASVVAHTYDYHDTGGASPHGTCAEPRDGLCWPEDGFLIDFKSDLIWQATISFGSRNNEEPRTYSDDPLLDIIFTLAFIVQKTAATSMMIQEAPTPYLTNMRSHVLAGAGIRCNAI